MTTTLDKDDLFCLKKQTLKRKLGLLEQLLKERETNLEQNLHEIQENMCFCNSLCQHTSTYNQELYNKVQLQNKLPLYREQRQLKTDFLRDTAILKRDLLDTLLDYHGLRDKQSFIE